MQWTETSTVLFCARRRNVTAGGVSRRVAVDATGGWNAAPPHQVKSLPSKTSREAVVTATADDAALLGQWPPMGCDAMRCDAMCSASSRRTDAAADVDARLFNGGDRTALESVYLHYDDYLRRTHRCAGLGLSGPLPHRHRRSGSLAPTNGLGAGP